MDALNEKFGTAPKGLIPAKAVTSSSVESDLGDALKELNTKLHKSMQELEQERDAKKELENQLQTLKDQGAGDGAGAAASGDSDTAELTTKVAKLEKSIETWKVSMTFVQAALIHSHFRQERKK